LKDANKSILGIEPPVTLAQANEIAAMADAIEGSDADVESPFAVAISNFKKAYEVKDGKWTKKAKAEEAYRELAGRRFRLGDFLVYGDKADPQTWHLVVREKGKPNHIWMRNAWAALHEGHKGMRYEGPLRELARKRLRKLFEAERIAVPDERRTTMRELTPDSLEGLSYQVSRAFDFACGRYPNAPLSVDDVPQWWVQEVFAGHPQHEDALVTSFNDGPFEQYYMVGYSRDGDDITFQPEEDWRQVVPAWEYVEASAEAAEAVEFEETAIGHAVSLSERKGDDLLPMYMEVCLIRPGWGNKRDMNYYSPQMLKENAEAFVKAKMFEKDHTADKTNRDFVSAVESISGFGEDGSVLAQVVVVEEDFAKKARALQDAGLLELLECSILAEGKARRGSVNGVKGKIVEQISEVHAVDWVTKAGAGGHAVSLKQ